MGRKRTGTRGNFSRDTDVTKRTILEIDRGSNIWKRLKFADAPGRIHRAGLRDWFAYCKRIFDAN